jgi:hypothetical protein
MAFVALVTKRRGAGRTACREPRRSSLAKVCRWSLVFGRWSLAKRIVWIADRTANQWQGFIFQVVSFKLFVGDTAKVDLPAEKAPSNNP